MQALIKTGIFAGVRGKSIQGIALLGVLLVSLAYLSGEFSPRQPQTIAMDVGFSFLRITLVFFVIFWVQELVSKEIDRKTILFTLAYPIPRWHYLAARYISIAILTAFAALLFSALMWLAAKFAMPNYQQSFPPNLGLKFWLTVFGIYLDSLVVAAFCLWVASLSTTPMMPLASGLLFAVAGKSMGAVLAYIEAGADDNETINTWFKPFLKISQWILPDLSRLDWRISALYDLPIPTSAIYATGMAISYIALLLSLSALMFKNRELF